jgi:hypothetical protein
LIRSTHVPIFRPIAIVFNNQKKQAARATATLVDSEEEYEVDHVRDSKVFGRTLKYLVHWKGYREGEDTWELAKNLSNAKAKVDEFHAINPGAPCKIAALIHASLPWQSPMVFTSANVDVSP